MAYLRFRLQLQGYLQVTHIAAPFSHRPGRVLAIAERLAAADPANARYRCDLAYVRQRLAKLT